MANATRFTNLEVTGNAEIKGVLKQSGLTKATYQSNSAKTLPSSMSDSYTKSEQTKILEALDDLRDKYDALVTRLADGTDPT